MWEHIEQRADEMEPKSYRGRSPPASCPTEARHVHCMQRRWDKQSSAMRQAPCAHMIGLYVLALKSPGRTHSAYYISIRRPSTSRLVVDLSRRRHRALAEAIVVVSLIIRAAHDAGRCSVELQPLIARVDAAVGAANAVSIRRARSAGGVRRPVRQAQRLGSVCARLVPSDDVSVAGGRARAGGHKLVR